MNKGDIIDTVGFIFLAVAAYKITWLLFAFPDASPF